jgi:hypothetical protein
MIIFHYFAENAILLVFHHIHIKGKHVGKPILGCLFTHFSLNSLQFMNFLGLALGRTAMIDHCVNDFAGAPHHVAREFEATAAARSNSFGGLLGRALVRVVVIHGTRMSKPNDYVRFEQFYK